jgi:coenzyme F420-reducing hydrogenase delta subunit/ferredoxin
MSAESETKGAAATVEGAGTATWQPRITAFVCRWCTYAGADLAGTSRLKYPPQIRLIKLPCTGRIDPLFLLRAFAMGTDGVLVSGCHPGDCHYTSGNYAARRRWVLFRELLDFVGLEPGRVHFSWVSAAEGGKFVDLVRNVTDTVRALGPFPGFSPAEGALARGWATHDRASAMGPTPTELPGLDAMRADLASGAVRAVLGLRTGRRAIRPRAMWARSPEEIGLFTAADSTAPLVPLLVRRLREDPEGVYGILAGPGRREAIARLQAEQQIDPARVRVYARDGAAPASADTPAWEIHGVPGPDVPAADRWAFWTAAFSRCLRCYACREGCPTCSCVRCVADKTRPRWIDSSPTPAGNWVWNVTRAFHQAGRCVECGGCSDACPVGIPLAALSAHLNRVALRAFGPPSADELRSPLLFGRPDDQAPFIL